MSNGTRKANYSNQPVCFAFVDDTTDMEPYPHIHAVCCVRSSLVQPFENWLLGCHEVPTQTADARQAWKSLNADEIQVEKIRPSRSDLAKAVSYASKFHDRLPNQDAGEELMRSFPEKHSPHPNRNRMANVTLNIRPGMVR
ncbi:hypothetical protein [Kaistia nematophila]|uniref:Uncharacterized protein n=1 Tax=Kaistia nematophila TaxID=2994654 RepID=A0A9X3E5Q5_9HYPH|nr:hypothetical protein [Kaistia nematophila]MCX5572310.1 hypothetical protein [Kaistia nematophila]